VRAKIKRIDHVVELQLHLVMDLVHLGFAIHTASDTGLIRDDDDEKARVLQTFYGVVGERKYAQVIDVR